MSHYSVAYKTLLRSERPLGHSAVLYQVRSDKCTFLIFSRLCGVQISSSKCSPPGRLKTSRAFEGDAYPRGQVFLQKPFRVNFPRTASDIRIDILNGIGPSRLMLIDVSNEPTPGNANQNVTYELVYSSRSAASVQGHAGSARSNPHQFNIFSIRALRRPASDRTRM